MAKIGQTNSDLKKILSIKKKNVILQPLTLEM